MNNDVVFTYNSCILFYYRKRESGTEKKRERERGSERERKRENERKSRRVREIEHVKDGSWIADYVYEGIEEALGV